MRAELAGDGVLTTFSPPGSHGQATHAVGFAVATLKFTQGQWASLTTMLLKWPWRWDAHIFFSGMAYGVSSSVGCLSQG